MHRGDDRKGCAPVSRKRARGSAWLLACWFLLPLSGVQAEARTVRLRLPGDPYSSTTAEWETEGFQGSGRDFTLFDSRGGGDDDLEGSGKKNDYTSKDDLTKELLERYRRNRRELRNRYRPPAGLYGSFNPLNPGAFRPSTPRVLQVARAWWAKNVAPNLEKAPKIVCKVEPTTTLKLRKTFRPLKTIVRIGADFNSQLGVWQFTSSWEDAIIGGKLTLAGRELQLTKSWQLSVGAAQDLVTRLRFRAAFNLQTYQAYARVGFRTERLTPINVVEGFTLLKRLPLDGGKGNVKLEVKANVALPEPELEYSTETQQSVIGNMGDVEVSIDELNLLLDY